MHLLVEGVCNAVAYGGRSLDPTKLFDHPMYSGFLFDLKVGNAFGVYLGQEQIRLRCALAIGCQQISGIELTTDDGWQARCGKVDLLTKG